MFERRSVARRGGGLALVLVIAASACSGSDESSSSTVEGAAAVDSVLDDPFAEVTTADGTDGATGSGSAPPSTTDPPVEGTPDEPPIDDGSPPTTVARVAPPAPSEIERIVSLSPSHTETLFELGLADLVVAVDGRSDFPVEAQAVGDPQLDVSASTLDAVLGYKPDLVVIGDDPTGMADRLSAAGVATYVGTQPDSLDEVYEQIESIAAIVGRDEAADQLVGRMRAEVDSIVNGLPAGATDAGLTVFHEIDPSLFTPSSASFYSDLYATLGLTNIAGPGDSGRVTQLTNDELIAADPDVIVLADVDCCAVTPERVAVRPGWADVSAVRSGAIVGVPDPIVMRWGPRVVELLRLVADGMVIAAS